MGLKIALAVDGGASKTDLALVSADGALLAHPLVGQWGKVEALLEQEVPAPPPALSLGARAPGGGTPWA